MWLCKIESEIVLEIAKRKSKSIAKILNKLEYLRNFFFVYFLRKLLKKKQIQYVLEKINKTLNIVFKK